MHAIQPLVEGLCWHPVTPSMGNSRYREADAIIPLELKPIPSNPSSVRHYYVSVWYLIFYY